MQTPLDFLNVFRAELRAEGIRFAITSGMACVRYGLQQTTKDSDWILPPDQSDALLALFAQREASLPPWTVRYRTIFGAPLAEDWSWPRSMRWVDQHGLVLAAAQRHGLTPAPLTEAARFTIYEAGLARAAVLANIEPARLAEMAPPIDEVLP